jgi:hypothetical protein
MDLDVVPEADAVLCCGWICWWCLLNLVLIKHPVCPL